MTLVATSAVVLQTYRYSETSKIVRLATRDLGVQSAIAKGALRPKSPFGGALETLSEGVAQLYHKDTRDLQTLTAFDVTDLRRGLAGDLSRLAGAAALAEVMTKMAPAASLPVAYDTLTRGLDALAAAPTHEADAVAARWLWLLVGVLGFAPELDACVRDGTAVGRNGAVAFSTAEGGVLCGACAGRDKSKPGPTRLPSQAYLDLLALNDAGAAVPQLDVPHAAAHRRLVARFVRQHLGDPGPLKAMDFWERHAWRPATPSAS